MKYLLTDPRLLDCFRKGCSLVIFIFLFYSGAAKNFKDNSCDVVAAFSPGSDTSYTNQYVVYFQNTSSNANTVRWFINGIDHGNGESLTLSFSVGLWEIKLVASNGSCSDTAVAYHFNPGNTPSQRRYVDASYGIPGIEDLPGAITGLKDGGFLLGGSSILNPLSSADKGLLVKLKDSACVEWSKLVVGQDFAVRVTALLSLKDSGFLVAGSNYPGSPFLLRCSKSGEILWKKQYPLQVYVFNKLFELADGSFVVTGSNAGFAGFFALKLEGNGEVSWAKLHSLPGHDFAQARGITELGNMVYFSGHLSYPNNEVAYNGEYNRDGFILALNSHTGETAWTKHYGAVGSSDYFQDIHAVAGKLIVNNVRTDYLGSSNVVQTFHFLDLNGLPINSYKVNYAAKLDGSFNSNLLLLNSGEFYLSYSGIQILSLQPGYAYHTLVLKFDQSANILWSGRYWNPRTRMEFFGKGAADELGMLGSAYSSLLVSTSISKDLQFVKVDAAGMPEGHCTLEPGNMSISEDQIGHAPLNWFRDTVIHVPSWDAPIHFQEQYTEARYHCDEYVDACSFVKVDGPRNACNLKETYTYKLRRSSSCDVPVAWTFSKDVEVVRKTPVEVEVKFRSHGNHVVTAEMQNSCSPVKHSIEIIANPPAGVPELGGDTTICKGTILTLHPGPGFAEYEWQDGSRDSIFRVREPGKYHVIVRDGCDNFLTDTVSVSYAEEGQISAGPDLKLCAGETFKLEAPAGFQAYVWSNNLNSIIETTAHINNAATEDIIYYLRAEEEGGCFAFDTIEVKVLRPPLIRLGADTSFCKGDSVVFDAGGGFKDYLWSTGSTSREIAVHVAGIYTVTATTTDGCRGFDTVRVIEVYPLPNPKLDKSSSLCSGNSRLLDAGIFESYLWQNGSVNRQLPVKDTGLYTVVVTDKNGCRAGDSTRITHLLTPPANFLGPDTAICSYGSLNLKADKAYKSYKWNTGSDMSSVTINQPGTYSLEVVDQNGCSGKDTVVVKLKQCMSGFYIPTAFTPNGDGKNDVFRPLLFGNVKKFIFTIYNRWGQVVFRSEDPQKGWDGKLTKIEQGNFVFVWTCLYQLEGEPEKFEKGNVTLMR